ncbi:MAG TPA: VOC family protein [Polyangia bacterium]|jgi:Lactoylglutathione lyase and related lyases|nr:VOC family protein [Polyangia bacterium]
MDAIRIEHVAIWVRDLERMRQFYVAMLGAKCGTPYQNPRTGFRSIFVSFADGARVELMSQSGQLQGQSEQCCFGYAHLALSLGTRAAVDATVARLESHGVVVLSQARVTGDGYYEAALADPEGNRIELVA